MAPKKREIRAMNGDIPLPEGKIRRTRQKEVMATGTDGDTDLYNAKNNELDEHSTRNDECIPQRRKPACPRQTGATKNYVIPRT